MCWPFAVALFVLLLVQQAACSDRDRLMSDSPLDALAKEAVWTGQGKLRGPMPQGDPNEAVMKVVTFVLSHVCTVAELKHCYILRIKQLDCMCM
jgi:hypothetical protein